MDNTLYVALSHQLALQRQMDLIANNLANANTTGFRRENAVFETFLDTRSGASGAGRSVNYVLDHGIARDAAQGDLQTTQAPLDVAILGDGYFTVQQADGARAYTRNGHFELSGDGRLVTSAGAAVLDSAGKPITFDAADKAIRISDDGSVHASSGEKGQLGLVTFAADDTLERLGDTLYASDRPIKVSSDAVRLKSGTLESSNVKPIMETTAMIDVLRTYQETSRFIERYDDMRKRGLERLGRSS